MKSLKFIDWFNIIGVLFGFLLAVCGYYQIDRHLEWSNYNDLNLRYSNHYMKMPKDFSNTKLTIDELKYNEMIWIRAYFNLTSEQYYLFQEKLIPEEMWNKRIIGGLSVNLKEYPILIKGYEYWKANGAFSHPSNFTVKVDGIINSVDQQT